jgi:micrococcal nuclease
LLVSVLGAGAAAGERSLAPPACAESSATEVGKVAEVRNGGTLVLENGLPVRLSGIELPTAGGGSQTGRSSPAAQARLEAIANQQKIRFVPGAADRHGRIPSAVYLSDGRLVQAMLVAEGWARVHRLPGEAICLEGLLVAERAARIARRGLWDGHEYAIWSADDPSLIGRNGLYELVEGRVISVGRGSRMVFLNFGRDWKRDFTVMLPPEIADGLAASGTPIESLAMRRVRVRGLIEESGGPAIRLADVGGLELLDE